MNDSIIIRPTAMAEFDLSVEHYRQVAEQVAKQFVHAIDEILDEISLDPTRYPHVEGDVREAPVKDFPFAVYYRTRRDRVIVLAIYHQSRDPLGWQNRS